MPDFSSRDCAASPPLSLPNHSSPSGSPSPAAPTTRDPLEEAGAGRRSEMPPCLNPLQMESRPGEELWVGRVPCVGGSRAGSHAGDMLGTPWRRRNLQRLALHPRIQGARDLSGTRVDACFGSSIPQTRARLARVQRTLRPGGAAAVLAEWRMSSGRSRRGVRSPRGCPGDSTADSSATVFREPHAAEKGGPLPRVTPPRQVAVLGIPESASRAPVSPREVGCTAGHTARAPLLRLLRQNPGGGGGGT